MAHPLNSLAQRLWRADPGLAARAAGWIFSPLGGLYGLAMRFRFQAYARGLFKMSPAPLPVISVGNLTQGGTGKTPLTLYLASLLLEKGFRPAVVLRGYGGTVGPGPVLVKPGDDPALVGDEALTYAGVPGLLVVAGSNRAAGAQLSARSGAGVVLLDDGFQHLGLARNLDLVLLDAARPLGNRRVFPAGPLREPLGALSRASALVLTRCDSPEQDRAAKAALGPQAAQKPIFLARHAVPLVQDPESGDPLDIQGKRVLVAAGVAFPVKVDNEIRKLGPAETRLLPFTDHQVYTSRELDLIKARAREFSADLVVTTSKDLPKLGPALKGSGPALGLARLEVRLDREPELAALVEKAARGLGSVAGVLKRPRRTLAQRFPRGGRMLIRMPNWLGDTVMATPVLENLKRCLPQWSVSLLVDHRYAPLFQADPRVAGLIPYHPRTEHKGVKGRRALAKNLRDRFQAGLLLTNSLDSAYVFWRAGIKVRAGYGRDGRSLLLTDPVPFTRPVHKGPQVDSYLGLLQYLGLEVFERRPKVHLSPEVREWAGQWLGEMKLDQERPLIGIGPGAAFGVSKAWPVQRFAMAAQELKERTGAAILIFGSKEEQKITGQIASQVGPGAFDLAGRTTLDQAAALVSRLDLMVANDSGLMNLAAGLGVRPLVLFGPTDPPALHPQPGPGQVSVAARKMLALLQEEVRPGNLVPGEHHRGRGGGGRPGSAFQGNGWAAWLSRLNQAATGPPRRS